MANIRPFRALRPEPKNAAQVAAVPYDVVNRAEAAKLAEGNAASFLHVSRPEIDLPADLNPYAPEVYGKARDNFERLTRDLPLVRENEPSLYLYQLKMGGRTQTGVAAAFSLDEYDRDLIKKHEKTRKEKEDDRTRHILSVGAQTGPVFLTYRGSAKINSLVEKETGSKPLFDFTAADGVTHTVWKIAAGDAVSEAFREIPCLYIADGHHRAASASRARAEQKKKTGFDPTSDQNFFLAVAFPEDQLKILPYFRVVKDLHGLSTEQLLGQVAKSFEITPNASPEPARGGFSMYLERRWYGLVPKYRPPQSATKGAQLDVSILQDQLLAPILGVGDPRTDHRIDFVGGIRGTKELVRLVDGGAAAVAFSLHPTTVSDLMEISDAGEIMPPKSTWFEPKLRDGLLSHVIE